MPDSKYCYPDSDVLINKLGIKDSVKLFMAEKEATSIRLYELQQKPIKGKFNLDHLKAIHKYIFQDIYEWAGEQRTVDIGKGNLFVGQTLFKIMRIRYLKNTFHSVMLPRIILMIL